MNNGSRLSLTVLGAALLGISESGPITSAQAASAIPPGVPEPGLVIWGAVVNRTNTAQSIRINSAIWSVTDGAKTAVYSDGTTPPTRIVNIGDASFYILEVPFDTRRLGNVVLSDPALTGLDSFELKSATPPTYTLSPTINGALANVQSVDGAPSSGATLPVAGFSAATRGRVIRVDLSIIPLADGYDAWATANFGNANLPQAARTADPDGDGLANEGEFAAGTDPKSAASVLRILTLTLDEQGDKATLDWRSVSNKRYIIETASNPQGPWVNLGTQVPGAADQTRANVPLDQGEPIRFYRIRLAP